jgi:hypothetical protein
LNKKKEMALEQQDYLTVAIISLVIYVVMMLFFGGTIASCAKKRGYGWDDFATSAKSACLNAEDCQAFRV